MALAMLLMIQCRLAAYFPAACHLVACPLHRGPELHPDYRCFIYRCGFTLAFETLIAERIASRCICAVGECWEQSRLYKPLTDQPALHV